MADVSHQVTRSHFWMRSYPQLNNRQLPDDRSWGCMRIFWAAGGPKSPRASILTTGALSSGSKFTSGAWTVLDWTGLIWTFSGGIFCRGSAVMVSVLNSHCRFFVSFLICDGDFHSFSSQRFSENETSVSKLELCLNAPVGEPSLLPFVVEGQSRPSFSSSCWHTEGTHYLALCSSGSLLLPWSPVKFMAGAVYT